jgi:hypothetical protein
MMLETYQILYSIRQIGDIEDPVLYYPYFWAFYG